MNFDIKLYDEILARGLSNGIGKPNGQMCIEAAVCTALGYDEHSDAPECVSKAVREYKIVLNDSNWSSPAARSVGLRDLGIAQLGSSGVVDDIEFSKRLVERTIRVLIPTLFREVLSGDSECMAAADRCEAEGTCAAAYAYANAYAARAARASAYSAAYASAAAAKASAAYAASAANAYANANTANAARASAYSAAYASAAAAKAARAANDPDKYLLLSASIALQILREMKSPGCELLRPSNGGQSCDMTSGPCSCGAWH